MRKGVFLTVLAAAIIVRLFSQGSCCTPAETSCCGAHNSCTTTSICSCTSDAAVSPAASDMSPIAVSAVHHYLPLTLAAAAVPAPHVSFHPPKIYLTFCDLRC